MSNFFFLQYSIGRSSVVLGTSFADKTTDGTKITGERALTGRRSVERRGKPSDEVQHGTGYLGSSPLQALQALQALQGGAQQARRLGGRRVVRGRGGRRRHAPRHHVLAPRGARRAHGEQRARLPRRAQRLQHLRTHPRLLTWIYRPNHALTTHPKSRNKYTTTNILNY